MGWLIAVVVVVAAGALVWWTSGRARPDLRRNSIDAEIGKRQGEAGGYGGGFRHGGGPTPNGGSGF